MEFDWVMQVFWNRLLCSFWSACGFFYSLHQFYFEFCVPENLFARKKDFLSYSIKLLIGQFYSPSY